MWRILSLLERCLFDRKHQGYAAFFYPVNPQLSVISQWSLSWDGGAIAEWIISE